MKKTGVQWVIQDSEGLKGPFDTAVVLKLIREGSLRGNEVIAKYPDGDWKPISKRPEFYDSLIETLEGALNKERLAKNKSVTEETLFMPIPLSATEGPLHKTSDKVISTRAPQPQEIQKPQPTLIEMPAQQKPALVWWSRLEKKEKLIGGLVVIAMHKSACLHLVNPQCKLHLVKPASDM
jgi:hypothetical protein